MAHCAALNIGVNSGLKDELLFLELFDASLYPAMNERLDVADPARSVLLTDLYQLAMLDAYLAESMNETAVFELFIRRLPTNRAFLIAAGLEQALDYLENLHFSDEELGWLGSCGKFSDKLVDALETFRFTGDVHAMPEGTVVFANEPLLRVTAPMLEAQLVESRLVNIIHLQTVLASKAARIVLTAGRDKLLVDFGMRRAHGCEAALFAARASYIAGFTGTATVLADKLYGIPSYGTMAHSFVQAHDSEAQAFVNFARAHPDNAILLIDTYDTEVGARKVVDIAPGLRAEGITIKAVRLDSGDLAQHAHRVRAILDEGGCEEIRIFCSGNLDEFRIRELLEAKAPVDGFGVGTHLDVSIDAPSIDCVYKLEEYAGRARRKRSPGKATWPGRKQVFRSYKDGGIMAGDMLTLEDDAQGGKPLLATMMQGGTRLQRSPALTTVRERAASELASLPKRLRGLEPSGSYRIEVSQPLRELTREVDRASA